MLLRRRALAGGTALAASVSAVGVGVQKAGDLPCAVHEAGHVCVALHVAEHGLSTPEGRLVLHGTTPTLLYSSGYVETVSNGDRASLITYSSSDSSTVAVTPAGELQPLSHQQGPPAQPQEPG